MSSKLSKFSIIGAFVKGNRGIGMGGTLPWKIKEDMEWFKEITADPIKHNTVIMGRKTWDSLPTRFKPLPGRDNIILSRTFSKEEEYRISMDMLPSKTKTLVKSSIEEALARSLDRETNNFIIGGSQVYEEAIIHENCDKLYLTEIDEDVYNEGKDKEKFSKCDAFFPKVPGYFSKVDERESTVNPGVKFQVWKNRSDRKSEEMQYLSLLRDILDNGEKREDRTGTGTRSLFGRQLRFSLSNSKSRSIDIYNTITLPLLTTKKVYFKGVVEELLFFLRGDHDNRKLRNVGVHIWDGNTSR